MAKVAIVTDSTSDLPEVYNQQYHIRTLPQVLIWSGNTYRDRIDIQPTEFYKRLKTDKAMPSTSQASPQDFHQVFTSLLDEGYEVLAVVLSSDLSGTHQSAVQAKALLPGAPIEIVDSRTASMALGYTVLYAARAAEKGASLAECKAIAERACGRTGVLFVVDTFEFLHRGGRIGGATRLLGSALNIKPILEIVDGHVEPADKVRTRKKSLTRLLDIIGERVAGKKQVRISVLHANSPEDAQWVMEEGKSRFHPVESIMTEVSPVIGTHVGPGTVGMVYMVDDD